MIDCRDDIIEAARRQTKPKMIEARYPGRCRWCSEAIVIGQIIAFSSLPGARYILHSGCYCEAWLSAHEGHENTSGRST